MLASLLVLDRHVAMNTGSIFWSLIFKHLFVDSKLEHPIPRAVLQELIQENAVLVPTSFPSLPFVETEVAETSIVARGAYHSVGLQTIFTDSMFAFGTLFGKLFLPILAEPFLKLDVLFLCEDPYFSAFVELPDLVAD